VIYARQVSTTGQRWAGRATIIATADEVERIPVPDDVVLCNGCNCNLHPEPGYMVYLDKRELKADRPYDVYCLSCLKQYFPKYQLVE